MNRTRVAVGTHKVAGVLAAWLACAGPAAADDQQAPRLPAVDALLSSYVEHGRVAGLVAMVSQHGRVVHQAAYG